MREVIHAVNGEGKDDDLFLQEKYVYFGIQFTEIKLHKLIILMD
jgi:hypothetical protein